TSHVPGLQATRQLDHNRWQITYDGHTTEIQLTVRTDLPAGHAQVTPDHIHLSANTPDGTAGTLLTTSLLAAAVRTHATITTAATNQPTPSTPQQTTQPDQQTPTPPAPHPEPQTPTTPGNQPTDEATTTPKLITAPIADQGTRPQTHTLRAPVQQLLPQLAGGSVPGPSAVAATSDPSVWTLTYDGTSAQVRITVSDQLPAGQALIEPGSITVSGYTADGPS